MKDSPRQESWDVIVVGAGPAGASAAIWCMRAGFQVLLVDKQEFPRDKPCGGLITQKGLNELALLGYPVHSLQQGELDISLYNHHEKLLTFKSSSCAVVQREMFDNELLGMYLAMGGVFQPSCCITEVNTDDHTITDIQGRVFLYRSLILATGIHDHLAEKTSAQRVKTARCVVSHTELNGDCHSAIDVFFVPGRSGFGWRFAGDNSVNIGVGFDGTGHAVRQAFDMLFPGAAVHAGAVNPTGRQPKPHNKAGILLIGDAGGYVNTLLGEGISYALASGRAAANIVSGKGFILDRELRRNIRYYRWVHHVFYYPPVMRLIMRVLLRHPDFSADLCEALVLSADFRKFSIIREALRRLRSHRRGKR